jgi:hypothetical protein
MQTQKDFFIDAGHSVHMNQELEPMPDTKIRAFVDKEFPWIKKYANGPISRCYVTVVEPSFLDYYPVEMFSGSDEILLLLNREKEVVTAEREISKKGFFSRRIVKKIKKISGIVTPRFSVKEVVEQLGDKANLVHFLVSYLNSTEAVIIYKIPGKLSLGQLIRNEIEKERKKFSLSIR